MDKKLLGYVSVALLACCALMLTVIGGLYAYNTFAGSSSPVYAAGTSEGPDWTVTSLLIDSNNEYIVVVTRTKNPIEDPSNPESLQMACYQLRARAAQTARQSCSWWQCARSPTTCAWNGPTTSSWATARKRWRRVRSRRSSTR